MEPWRWSLREMVIIAETRGMFEWDYTLFLGEVVANSSPNMGSKRRRPVELQKLNPYRKKQPRRGRVLTGEAGDKVLETIAARSK